MYYNDYNERQQSPAAAGQPGMMGQMGMTGQPGIMGQPGMMGQMGMMGDISADRNLAGDISRAVILEVQAYNLYQHMIGQTSNEQFRQILFSIQRDEMRHYHWFTMMLRMMGVQLPQIPMVELPVDFNTGVRIAIRNELEAAAFYQNISYRAVSHHVQMHFMHAALDEQRHASLFQYILSNIA